MAWQNDSLRLSWRQGEPSLLLQNLRTAKTLPIPVGISEVALDIGVLESDSTDSPQARVSHEDSGETWRFVFPPRDVAGTEISIRVVVEFEMAAARPWIHKRASLHLTGSTGPVLLDEVVTDTVDMTGLSPRQPYDGVQSYPVLAESFFAGVEFPVARARVGGESVTLSARPGVRLSLPARHDTWSVVYGVSQAEDVRQSFEDYIATLRPPSPPLHIQYNSWWSAPYPFSEQHMLDLVSSLGRGYCRPYRGRLDSFCLDMGWANPQSIWELDTTQFPNGLGPLKRALGELGAEVALWISPSSTYPLPGAQDTEWARQQGYETHEPRKRRLACLAGPRYQQAFKQAVVRLMRRYNFAHFKFDGYHPTCDESDHGHEPGELSAEKTSLGLIDAVEALRELRPDVWLEATCFGFEPSPWWLAYFTTVIGYFGTDAPRGRVPCPVYRESYTTSRDFFNILGTRTILLPVHAQEVLGIIHQTPEPFYNDAVITVLRGHDFIPLYINPEHMTDRRWRFLARLMKWTEENAHRLRPVKALCFGRWADEELWAAVTRANLKSWTQEVPKDVYGYAHFTDGAGLVLLRNPWVRPTRVEVKLDESSGCGPSLQDVAATCLYPRYGGLAGRYSYGDRLAVELGPYETRLLDLKRGETPAPAKKPASEITVADRESRLDESTGTLIISFIFGGCASPAAFWLLAEGQGHFAIPTCHVRADGEELPIETHESLKGWGVGALSPHAWVWFVTPMPGGRSRVEIRLGGKDPVTASAWLVPRETVSEAPQRVPGAPGQGPIPPPEYRWLDAVDLLSPTPIRPPQSHDEPTAVPQP